MNKSISILDSTLRDGGYCNNWDFGDDNKHRIIDGLIAASIDIIECGLLCNKDTSIDKARYSCIEDANSYVTHKNNNSMFVLLMNYGEYDLDLLPECQPDGIDGIRIAFHKKDLKAVFQEILRIKSKKYKVFIQPMVAMSYTTEEFVELLNLANEVKPYAFYVVDSFGNMQPEDVKKYASLANYILEGEIFLGLHSHNNLQLAFSNAQLFGNEIKNRNLIIDSCIMGMGRGAGNLNTELFMSYANNSFGSSYKVEPVLKLIDEIISVFYEKNSWGYSLPNYLSASYGLHPNYGTYISDKNTLTISMLDELFSLVDAGKKCVFDKEYIEDLYFSYMCAKKMEKRVDTQIDVFYDKEILIIAPGKSVDEEIDTIERFVTKNQVLTISVNFDFKVINVDYIFLSNPKRCNNVILAEPEKIIITSNVDFERYRYMVDYLGLLCDEEQIRDNATMMLIKLLINSGAKKVYLASVDGYSLDIESNYTQYSTELVTSSEHILKMNVGMNNVLKKYSEIVNIEFVTSKRKIGRQSK
jgi:4-hydroxy 2-oxovalerate aldolase